MKKRRELGQHFLNSEPIANSIVKYGLITKKDIVYEIGTGHGILLPHLCRVAKKVISVETDKELFKNAMMKFSNCSNLILKHGDGFKLNDNFTIFVSNLPYSKSRKAMEWLVQKKFLRAILMVQKEFADKLLSKSKKRKAISVLVNYCTNIEKVMDVKKTNFSPRPKVDSVVLRLTKKHQLSNDVIKTVNRLFSYRKKTIRNVVKEFGMLTDLNKRFENLSGDEIIRLAKQICKN